MNTSEEKIISDEMAELVSGGDGKGVYTTTASFTCKGNKDFDIQYYTCVGEYYIMNEGLLWQEIEPYRAQELERGLYQISFEVEYLGIYMNDRNCGLFKSGTIVFQKLG